MFVDPATFERASAAGRFLEEAEVFGQRYGTPAVEVPEGHDLLLEIDVQGARKVRSLRPDAVVILVEPPSRQIQHQRLQARGDDEAVIADRMAQTESEESQALPLADHVVVNDDLGRASQEVAGIVAAHRSQRSRPSPEEV